LEFSRILPPQSSKITSFFETRNCGCFAMPLPKE
jgi:hypothetical protein